MAKILDSAERLIALHGVEGVPLRQVLIAAKQKNKYAITLYFGGKDELVAAVVARRVDEMNVRRRELIAAAEAAGAMSDVRTLLEIIYRPLAEVSDATGQYTYARFLNQVAAFRAFTMSWPPLPADIVSLPGQVTARLRSLVPQLSDPLFSRHVEAIAGFYLSSLSARGMAVAAGRSVLPFPEFFDDLMRMMTAAFLTVPAG